MEMCLLSKNVHTSLIVNVLRRNVHWKNIALIALLSFIYRYKNKQEALIYM